MNRDELIKRLEELDPSDEYHGGDELEANSYYAAIDRAIRIVEGSLSGWADKTPKHEARKPHPLTMIGRGSEKPRP